MVYEGPKLVVPRIRLQVAGQQTWAALARSPKITMFGVYFRQ